MLVSEEMKWLYRELWTWRAYGLLLMLAVIGVEIMKWNDLNHHSQEVVGFQEATEVLHEQQNLMLQRNWELIAETNSKVDHCASCHAHPDLIE